MARQHPRNLGQPLVPGDLSHIRVGDGVGPRHGRLRHDEMVICARGNLGEVGHHDDLSAASELSEPPADLDRGPAADARIHLVEHEGRRAARTRSLAGRKGHFDREHDARELAARCALPE